MEIEPTIKPTKDPSLASQNLPQIQNLPSDVVDQIAAGEVVERPAHLVKELVENSLDAKARRVRVEVSNSGREILVVDDGHGIASHQLEKALDRFATSKIVSTEDLWRLKSYGFRGEALASIAAVSDLLLTSKPRDQDEAFSVRSQFGRRFEAEAQGASHGTRVWVRQLFENVPARLKFMKSAASEVAQIKNVIKAMALTHWQTEFQLVYEDQLVLDFPVALSQIKRAEQVFNLSPLYFGEAAREDYRARAFFSDPQHVQKSSKNIWIFAQERWIQDRTLQAAVMEAYRSLLMHGEYPSVAVFLEVPLDAIDVNIHPTKSQVKFQDPSLAFRAVQAALREALEKAPWIAKPPAPAQVVAPRVSQVQAAVENFNMSFQSSDMNQTLFKTKQFQAEPFLKESPSLAQAAVGASTAAEVQPQQPLVRHWSLLMPLGQVNRTYLVTQNAQSMVLIDQHAAHERVLYEKLMRAFKTGEKLEIQNFLFPLAVDLSEEKVEALLRAAPNFEKMGLHFETLGPSTLGVVSAPTFLKESALVQALERAAQEILDQGASFQFDQQLSDVCARLACHSAIRAGQALSIAEMQSLLVSMDESPLSSFCPHGRPVSIEYPFHKLEKDFGRLGS
jgi:DNA mismatch repair protein MutL